MRKLKVMFSLVGLMLCLSGMAKITLSDPVIEMEGDQPKYLKFSGENVDNNWKFTLDTYGTDGIKFQLTLDRIDASKAAAFTADDLADENYWEPLFRKYTKELAGVEMSAKDNIKRLFVNDVALMPSQFAGYCGGMNEVTITASGNYAIPDGCFAMGESEHYSIKKIVCQMKGKLQLGQDVVPADAGGLNVYTIVQDIAETWWNYKNENSATFTVYLNDEVYVGGDVSDKPVIKAVTLAFTLNSEQFTIELEDEGGTKMEVEDVTTFVLKNFTVKTQGNVTEVFMDYDISLQGQSAGQDQWKQIYATDQGNGVWVTGDKNINALEGLESNTAYVLELMFNTNPGEKGERAHYPTDGQTLRFKFITGNLMKADVNGDGAIDSADIVAVIKEMPDGDKKADVNGDGAIDSADIVAVIKAMK